MNFQSVPALDSSMSFLNRLNHMSHLENLLKIQISGHHLKTTEIYLGEEPETWLLKSNCTIAGQVTDWQQRQHTHIHTHADTHIRTHTHAHVHTHIHSFTCPRIPIHLIKETAPRGSGVANPSSNGRGLSLQPFRCLLLQQIHSCWWHLRQMGTC